MNCNQHSRINTAQFQCLIGSSIRFAMLIVLTIAIVFAPSFVVAGSKGSVYKEQQLQVAFVYNFLKFTDWPSESFTDQSGKDSTGPSPIVVAIVGKTTFDCADKTIKGKIINGRVIELRQISVNDIVSARAAAFLSDCHALFIGSDEKVEAGRALAHIKRKGLLTIGCEPGFLEDGGIINFIFEANKMRFEINMVAARESSLKVRSKLLRLAKRVIQDND